MSVDNVSGSVGDFTSTLEAIVDDIISNTTTITCELFTDEDHLTVIKIGISQCIFPQVYLCINLL